MSQPRLEWRVGLFVLLGLGLVAALMVQFSKGASFWAPSYEILLKTRNVGSVKKGAPVSMAGVPIGSVSRTDLTPDGRDVIIRLRILKPHTIRGDATFVIEQAGFLGDQYVSIVPTRNVAPPLREGALVTCQEPFNLQDAARAAAGFLQRIDFTAQKLNDAVVRLDRTLLSEENLTNLTTAVSNFRTLSERALGAAADLGLVVSNNAPGISAGVSNLVEFSRELNRVGTALEETVATNRDGVSLLVKNIDSASATVNSLLTDLQAGRGMAGGLLRDAAWQTQMGQTISNLSVVSSNLARFGLLYKPRPPRAPSGPGLLPKSSKRP